MQSILRFNALNHLPYDKKTQGFKLIVPVFNSCDSTPNENVSMFLLLSSWAIIYTYECGMLCLTSVGTRAIKVFLGWYLYCTALFKRSFSQISFISLGFFWRSIHIRNNAILSLLTHLFQTSSLRHLLSLMCQPEVYWLLKQGILLFCGWQNLNIKRLVCKQWISL